VAEIAAFTTDDNDSYSDASAHQGLEEVEIDDLSDPLLRSLNCVQHLVRAFRITTGSLVPEPTYQRLRPWVLTATREIDGEGPPAIEGVEYLSHRNLLERPPRKLEERQLLQWQQSVQLLSAKDPLSLYRERMIDAEYSVATAGE
jgi:hypothetical protein